MFPDPQWLQQYLQSGDLVGFIFAVFTRLIGPTFYALLFIGIAAPLYIRNQSAIPIAILSILFLALLQPIIPASALNIAGALLGLAIAALLYKTFR